MKKKISAILLTLVCVLSVFVMASTVSAASGKPGKVKMVGVCPVNYNQVRVVWNKTSGATDYVIYYKKKGASKWIKKETVAKSNRDCLVTFSVGKDFQIGKEYLCTVRAYNKKTKKYGGFDKKGLKFKTLPETVVLSDISLNSDKTGVVLTWEQEGSGGQIQGGDYYLIYRKTSGKWKQIAKVKSDTLTYTDKKFAKGKSNTYTVRSYNSKTKAKGEFDKNGVSIDLKKKKPLIVLHNPTKEILLSGSTQTYTINNMTNNVKWSSSNKKVVKIVSSSKNKCRVKALKNGTAELKIKDGNMFRTLTIVVASGNDYVNKWVKNVAALFRSMKVDTEARLLSVSMFMVSNFAYENVYDMKSVISQRKGNCYSAGQVMAKIYQAMGYKAKVRSAIHDKKSRYPDNFIMGSDHYNVEVVADGRKYYLDANPGLAVVYLSSPKEPLAAYFNFFGQWQRTL